jgi:hypothetical protein
LAGVAERSAAEPLVVGKLKERADLKDLSVDGRAILK